MKTSIPSITKFLTNELPQAHLPPTVIACGRTFWFSQTATFRFLWRHGLFARQTHSKQTINLYLPGIATVMKTVIYDTTSNKEEGRRWWARYDGWASTMPGTGAGMKSRREFIPFATDWFNSWNAPAAARNWSERSVIPGCIIVTDTAPSCTSSLFSTESGRLRWLRCRRDPGA